MKTLTRLDFYNIVKANLDWSIRAEILSGTLTTEIEEETYEDPAETYYKHTYTGFVEIENNKTGIKIRFRFIANAGCYDYTNSYLFTIEPDYYSVTLVGCTLIDLDGSELDNYIKLEFINRCVNLFAWEDKAMNLLPSLK